MNKRPILGMTVGLLLSSAAANAQVLQTTTKLYDGNNDGIIVLSTARDGFPKGARLKLCPDTAYTYVLETAACPDNGFAILDQGNFYGVNISGMEFSTELSVKETDIDFYAQAGVRSIRLPVKSERLTTTTKLDALKALVKRATDAGILMVIDYHSYLNIGDPRVEEFWTRVGPMFKGQPLVAFDLQNEPNGGTWATYGTDAKKLIANLRAKGIDNLFLLEWRQSSGASRMDKFESSTKACESAMCSLNRAPGPLDPMNRTWLSPHKYFDSDGSGTSTYCRDVTPSSFLSNSTNAARKYGLKLYLGEFAFGKYNSISDSCNKIGTGVVDYLLANSDVWKGGALWGAGPRWTTSYIFRLENPTTRSLTWSSVYSQIVARLWTHN